MIQLSYPFTQEKVLALKVGDEVGISGIVFTGRDAVHQGSGQSFDERLAGAERGLGGPDHG